MKRFEYALLGKELKAQNDIAKIQYQKLDNTFEFDKIIKKEEAKFKNYNKLNLIYNSKYSFYKYYRKNLITFQITFPSNQSIFFDMNF